MVKIDASEYEANWLTDNSGNSATPGEVDEASSGESEESESDSPNESEQVTEAASKALSEAFSSDRDNIVQAASSALADNSAPSEKTEKSWIPYRGPQGGEGWQNTENPNDVRYEDDPPGEVHEDYEGMAEEWGSGNSEENPENAEFGEWQEFERGDANFLNYGDRVAGERNGESFEGKVLEIADGDLMAVETPEGERLTVETWDVESYQSQTDELDETRSELREHFSSVGEHSDALEAYTDDSQYRAFQEHLRSAPEAAKESPMYDHHPKMETASAILATADKETAETMERIQSYAKQSLPREMEVYRGINVDAESFLDRAEQAQETGETITDEGFQSATIDGEVAEGFGNVTLDIQTDHGVYVRAASEHAGEDEVLLPAGTQFEVNGVNRETNTVEVRATGGFDFNLDVDAIRETMETQNLSYAEAVENVI